MDVPAPPQPAACPRGAAVRGHQRGGHGHPALACLGLSHYFLDLRSPLADNISAKVVGIGLGTLFRFWAYRRFVFSKDELLEDTSPLAHHGS